ncbi:hypothetical protein BgiBS90_027572 [Biomphalaria glabrata]|nr:hypothetical protein BgiBS90_027572 [Biomphalaria glabrata]
MGNKVDNMVSQVKERVDSLVKEQLPVDSLVKKLHGQDCGCTNSGDGDAGDWSAVCVCVVSKSCGCDFQDEKRDGDCCDDLNGMYRVERKETNEETWDSNSPNNGRDRNNEFDFGSGIRENSIIDNGIQAIDMNCICYAHAKKPSYKT